MKLKAMLLIILFSFIISCEQMAYTPDGSNLKSIPKPTTEIQVDLTDDIDTVYVLGTVDLNYDIDLQDGEFAFVNIYLDSTLIGTSSDSSRYSFNSRNFSDGQYNFSIEVCAHTNTGTLADLARQEFVTYRNNWTFIIDNNNTIPLEIMSIEPSNGSLLINWTKQYRPGFIEYQIYYGSFLRKSITDYNITQWIDSLYIGGEINCRIDVRSSQGNFYGNTIIYSDSIPEIINISLTEDNKAKIEWTKCKYETNFLYYNVRAAGEIIASIEDINTTEYVDEEFGFGGEVNYQIITGPGFRNPVASQEQGISYGNTCLKFIRMNYIQQLNSIYMVDEEPDYYYTTYRVNADNYNVISSIDKICDVTPNGQTAFAICELLNSTILEVNPLTLHIIDSLQTENFLGYKSLIKSDFFSANPSRLCYSSLIENYPNIEDDGIILLDVENDTLIAKLDISPTIIISISQNGENILVNKNGHELYKLEVNEFVFKTTIFPHVFFCFYDNSFFITTNNNQIKVIDVESLNEIDVFSIDSDLYQPTIDPITGYLGGYTSDRFYTIYNLNDGSLIQRIKIVPDFDTKYSNRFYFANSTLFSGEGYYLPLDLN